MWSKFSSGNYNFDSAILENKLGDIIPDVVVTREGEDLIVEFFVTHKCGPEKIAKIQELDIAAIEIDLSDLTADASKDEIEEGILDTCRRKWLHNPLVRKDAAAVYALRISSEADQKRERSRLLRTEKIKKLATDIINQLPEHETEAFDLDTWFSRTLPGRAYSMVQATEFDIGPYSSVISELQTLPWKIRLEPSPQLDFMGLPLQAELERALEEKRQEQRLA
jgi:hypothetical protein